MCSCKGLSQNILLYNTIHLNNQGPPGVHRFTGRLERATALTPDTTKRITSYSEAMLTSDLRGQRRHTVGDKWSTGPYCEDPLPRPFIDFLNDPLWSDLWGAPPPPPAPGAANADGPLSAASFSGHVHQWAPDVWFIKRHRRKLAHAASRVCSEPTGGWAGRYECKVGGGGKGTKGIDGALWRTRTSCHYDHRHLKGRKSWGRYNVLI